MKKIITIIRAYRKRMFILAMGLFIIAVSSLLIYAYVPMDNRNVAIIINIPKGTRFIKSVGILENAGLIRYRYMFYLLVMTRNVHRNIRAGEYELSTSMSPMNILNKLIRGDIKVYRITIPEDFTVREIVERLAFYRLVDRNVFMDFATDPNFLRSLKIEGNSIEGYLYPDTYLFDHSMDAREIINIMVNRFWKAITPEMRKRAEEIGMTLPEVITLASIIGKESGCTEEKPMISAVFHNRLKKGMKLQSDPTAIYNLEAFDGNITRNHLSKETPYNTYQITGLPPTPIANPAEDSLRAALYPAPVEYLFFVSNNEGSHNFSSNLKDHNKAVLRYQIKRKKS